MRGPRPYRDSGPPQSPPSPWRARGGTAVNRATMLESTRRRHQGAGFCRARWMSRALSPTVLAVFLTSLVCPPALGAEPPGLCPPTLKKLPRNILRDQEFLWLRPFRLKHADLPWVAGILGTSAGLVAIDRPVGQELSDTPPGAGFAFSRRVGQLSGAATDLGVSAAFSLIGRRQGNERTRTTGLLGFQAVTDSLIVVEVLKTASQRPRPTRNRGRLRNHNADGQFFAGGRSFPSGHAAEAWALATVVAHQYSHRRWVPPTAYGLAGLVAVARVTRRKHFPADIFVGGVLGYLIGRHVTNAGCEPPNHTPRRWRLAPYGSQDGGVGLRLSWQF